MKLLENKVVLVTGGTRGIGLGIVHAMAEAGAHVAFTYLNSEEKAKAIENELTDKGIKVKAYRSDAGNYQEAEALINSVTADFGTLHVLVNNAGITRDTLLLRMSEEQWDEVIQANLKSVFNLTKHALRGIL
jgi:Dehydrogenases with different specificities (related to short-chain alcohol dehydrogenases)